MLNISKATILNATSIQNKSFLKTKLSTKSVSALNTKHSNQSVSAQHRTVLSANTTVSSHCLQTSVFLCRLNPTQCKRAQTGILSQQAVTKSLLASLTKDSTM